MRPIIVEVSFTEFEFDEAAYNDLVKEFFGECFHYDPGSASGSYTHHKAPHDADPLQGHRFSSITLRCIHCGMTKEVCDFIHCPGYFIPLWGDPNCGEENTCDEITKAFEPDASEGKQGRSESTALARLSEA